MAKIKEYFEDLKVIHNSIPRTQCSQKNDCCKAGCPPLYYVEFLYLLDYFNSKLDLNKKREILNRCIDNYFSIDIIKPCPLFDNGCLLYNARPVNCRVYGIIPNCEYIERRKRGSNQFTMSAKEIKKKMGLNKIEDVPLYTQCECVKIVEDGKEKKEKMSLVLYHDIFDKLSEIEGKILSDFNVRNSNNSYKTFHDHYLFELVGEAVLEKWTAVKIAVGNDVILAKDIANKMKNNLKIKD